MNVKICKKCGIEKPSTSEYYPKSKTSKDGVQNTCKECVKERTKKWRLENKDRLNQYKQKWYEDNRDYVKEKRKIYYEQNREKISEYQKEYQKEYQAQYYDKNKDKLKEYKKDYYQNNKDKLKEYQFQYYDKNKDKLKDYYQKNKDKLKKQRKLYRLNNRDYLNIQNQNRRARIKELEATFTEYDWELVLNHFKKSCAYCGVKQETHIKHKNQRLHQDHFIPLSKGGTYTVDNIVPACASCNSSKRDNDFNEWYTRQDFYNKDREDKIINYLNTMKQN